MMERLSGLRGLRVVLEKSSGSAGNAPGKGSKKKRLRNNDNGIPQNVVTADP